ncbi:ATP-binding cassette domain-containing protein [Aquicella lusitana]|uniref:Putative ABC transport system ATP-binding protein n=1 Tax=Aquicella lusitana TaxID=254246 RepID=A0A370GLG9_9COXI|nr:ATP-binding cassette domain-containing protein [Aquicella lusitana]RDI44612.1 putative ABC transport system ATP-binding protein [Aquicella lusitana]VVC72446.1 Methionine import ATP-binding protein MetN 2 [Aquicella lusitana]
MTILNLKNVTLNFAAAGRSILDGINYEVNHGDFIILLGSNGSGKSTLLKLLHRDYQASSGQINFMGKPIMQYPAKTFSRDVAVLTQNCSDSLFTSLTIYENYLLMKQFSGLLKKSNKLERNFLIQYLADYNANLSRKLDVVIEQLSGGEKQALALALCFLQPPSLLLLDEHTSALDPKTSDQIMALTQKMITQHHITCIMTTHDLNIAMQYGNRILVLRDGKIYKTLDKTDFLRKEDLVANY